MPFYEYVCQKCGYEFEELQKISDKPLKKCPKCSGKVEKKVSLAGFQLKGGGWYADGYAKKDSKTSEKKPKESKKSKSGDKKA